MSCIAQYRAAIGRWHLFCICRPGKITKSYNCKLGKSLLTIGKTLRPSLVLVIFLVLSLLLLAGDVEVNPGPLNDLSICHINVRSLCPNDRTKRIDEIHSLLCIRDGYDIICISETWLNSSITNDMIDIQGYQLFRKDRMDKKGGGVAIYVSETIPARQRENLEHQSLEMLSLEIQSQGKRYILCCCYRPPGANANQALEFIDNLQLVINNIIYDEPESFFILGDLNDKCIIWDDEHNGSELGVKLVNLVTSNNLFQVINEPTHITPNISSTLDLIITDSPGYIVSSGVGTPIGDPYHCLIFCKIRCLKMQQKSYSRVIWKYNLGNYESLNDSLATAPWGPMEIFEDIDDAVSYFKQLFIETCKQFIPVKTVTIRPKDEPWITTMVRRYLRKRHRAFKKWKQHPSDLNYNRYCQIRIQTEEVKEKAKNDYHIKLSNKLCNPDTSVKDYWKLTKAIYGSKVKSGIPSLIMNNVVYSSAQDKCKIFNNHFAKKAALPNQLPHLPEFTKLTHDTFDNLYISVDDVAKVMKDLDISKATGPDGISNTLLKRTANSISTPLCRIFNLSIASGKFPTEWKEANLSPIFKANNKQDTNNYRPISLLSNIGKILERLVFVKLYDYCMRNDLLTWRNSAYKARDSTVNQLIYIVHKIYEALANGTDVCFVSLDASAAFDRVWHEGLIFKLKQFGIKGKMLNWFIDYLSNRKQRVVIEGHHSEWTYIKSGVPQGSILGPLLFLIYTNDIVDNIDSGILLFADDTCLLEPLLEGNISISKLNKDLETLSQWAKQWLVKFNPTKTKYLIFSKKLEHNTYNDLYLEGKALEKVDTHRHLGLIMNSRLTWDNHINHICTEAGKRLSIIKRLSNCIAPLTKIHIYKSFIRPVLEYGSVIFDSCSISLAEKIECVQKQATVASLRAYSNTSYNSLLYECGLIKLSNRRMQAKLILFYKIVQNITPDYLNSLLPNEAGNEYNLRNSNNIKLPKITKNYFLKSFFPSTIRAWNKLADNICDVVKIEHFKVNLCEIYGKPECYKPYLTGCSEGHINLSRIRLNLSGLNLHRMKYHFIKFSTCPNCDAPREDPEHFMLLCPAYAAQRDTLITQLLPLLPQHREQLNHLEIRANRKIILQIIIHGSKSINLDQAIFNFVSSFIESSKRFHY